jgi:predicted aldo/keto reductase-like oxidoreductase
MFDDYDTARILYREEAHHAENCNECGDCAVRCGRQIPIPDKLKEIKKILDE